MSSVSSGLVRLVVAFALLFAVLRPASATPVTVTGRWVAPLAGTLVVRRAFAPPRTRWGPGHRGVDLASYPGARVLAAGAGRVSFAATLAGRGVLAVTHGALRTTYEPVRPLLREGTAVVAGTTVALLQPGHPGPARPGEALLHWGLLRGDTYLDPLSLLRRGPSRLLPVAPAPPPGATDPGLWRPPRGAPTAVISHSRGDPPPTPPVRGPSGWVPFAGAGGAATALARRRRTALPARASPT